MSGAADEPAVRARGDGGPLPAAPTSELALRWMLIGLVAAVLLTFGRVVGNGWGPVDDEQTIWGNPRLNPPRFTADGVLGYWRHPHMSLYAPVTYTAWGIAAAASYTPRERPDGTHLDPGTFHAASLLAHLAAALLCFAVLRRLARRDWAALAGALLFALHPLQAESVAWASGLKDVLGGMFTLAAILCYLRAVDARQAARDAMLKAASTPQPPPPTAPSTSLFGTPPPVPATSSRGVPWAAWYALGLLAVALAMLAKPSAVVAPLIIAAIDALLLRRPIRTVALWAGPWLLLAIPVIVTGKMVQQGLEVDVPFWQRPVVAGASLAFYLWKLILPTGLAFDYGWRPPAMLQKGWFWALALAPLALAAILWLLGRRRPAARRPLSAAAAVFIAGLLPTLGLVPFNFQVHSTVSDHYAYLAMLGPAIAVAFLLPRGGAIAGGLPVARYVEGAVLALLAVLTIAQLGHWKDPETALRRTVAVNPSSALAHNNLGNLHTRARQYDRAADEFRRATEANPDYVPAHENLLRMYDALDRPDDAVRQFHALLAANARRPAALRRDWGDREFYRIGRATLASGRYDFAIRFLEEAVRLDPQNAEARQALAEARAKAQARPLGSGPVPRSPGR